MACVGSVPAARGLAGGRDAPAGIWIRAFGRGPPGGGAGRVKPRSSKRADQIQNRRLKKQRGANEPPVATVLAEIDLNPASI